MVEVSSSSAAATAEAAAAAAAAVAAAAAAAAETEAKAEAEAEAAAEAARQLAPARPNALVGSDEDVALHPYVSRLSAEVDGLHEALRQTASKLDTHAQRLAVLEAAPLAAVPQTSLSSVATLEPWLHALPTAAVPRAGSAHHGALTDQSAANENGVATAPSSANFPPAVHRRMPSGGSQGRCDGRMSRQELEPKEPKDKDRSPQLEPKDKDRSPLVRLDLKSTREALDATDNQRKQPADRLHDWLMLMAEHVEHAQADEKALRVKLDRELSDAAVGAAKAVGTTSVAATLKQRQKLQRQIDGARSRVHEVKDLVRTALAHHFLSALQGRLISQSAYAFSKWADAVGMECPAAMSAASGIIAHISATGDTGVDDGSGSFTSTCEGDVDGESRAASSQSPSLRGTQPLAAGVISPALQRLGLTTLAPTPGGRLEVAMPSLLPDADGVLVSPPGWVRRSSSFGRRGAADGGPGGSRASVSSLASRATSTDASHGTAAGGGTRLRRTSAFASHTAEAVLAQRGQGQVLEYQVKWRGFSDPRGTTWELASQLHGVAGFDEALVSFQASA